MRLSAQTHIQIFAKKALISFFVFLLLASFTAGEIHGQTQHTGTSSPETLNDFRTPDVEDNVPRNSHSYTQIVLFDVLSAVGCQLAGIDVVDETRPCIGYNPETKKLTSTHTFGADGTTPKIGGAIGLMSQQIGVLYQQPISSVEQLNYLASNFGIVENTYAQAPRKAAICNGNTANLGYGFCGLYPIMDIWQFVRNIAYAFLVIAFVVLALGIMLRFKIDARNVMTLQNQIPRVIISIILITFSYTMAGAMVDLMWTITYMGMAAITKGSGATMCDFSQGTGADSTVDKAAQKHILQTPVSFVNAIFSDDCSNTLVGPKGMLLLSNTTGGAIGDILTELVMKTVGINYNSARSSCGLTSLGDCIGAAVGFILSAIIKLIILIALFVTLTRLWFNLLKTVVLFLIFTIAGPIWIVFGLLPGRPMGFEKWFRLIFAHLIPFPLVAWMLTFAVVLSTEYTNLPDPTAIFIPPLIGNPNMNNFGTLLAFGLILLTPGIPDMIKQKMKVPPGGSGAIIRGNIASGGKVAGDAASAGWSRHTRRFDPETEKNAGFLRQFTYGRVLGMNKAEKTANGGEVKPTRRYKWATKLLGGGLGTRNEWRRRKSA